MIMQGKKCGSGFSVFCFFLTILIFFFSSSLVFAANICSYAGPDTSQDLMRLSNFAVISPIEPKVGDMVIVSFDLQAYGQSNALLGSSGIFAGAELSQKSKSFGYAYANAVLKPGESKTLGASRTLDEAGTWRIWPSYNLIGQNQQDLFGPYAWHACQFTVAAQAPADKDQDGIPDSQDNCPTTYNPKQEDIDEDGVGDACDNCDDRDGDNDGIKNCLDKCPSEPETINNYQDADGCPDSVTTSSNLKFSFTKKYGTGKKNDSVEVNVSNPNGVSFIEVFVDDVSRARCFDTTTCEARGIDLGDDSGIGARAFGPAGDFGTSGAIPSGAGIFDPSWVEDDDHDGIINMNDNCWNVSNTGQDDSDRDGVGDACDQCDAGRACSRSGFGRLSDMSYAECFGGEHFRFSTREPYYFEILYDLVDVTGCGCLDTDGMDYFTKGHIYGETFETSPDMSFEGGMERRCRAISSCTEGIRDRCINSVQLAERYCDSNGPQTKAVICPAGCNEGACTCPDTDGGYNIYEQGQLLGTSEFCAYPDGHLREADCAIARNGSLVISWTNVTCRFGCGNGHCICDDSDHGINYSVRGTIGEGTGALESYEEYCLDSRTMVEYDLFFSNYTQDCHLFNSTHRCEGRCSYGRCNPATCTDGIRDQNETDIDCGGPCTACGFVKINGTLIYEEADPDVNETYYFTGMRPIRYINLALYPVDSAGNPDISLFTLGDIHSTLTDSNGYFEFLIPREANRTYKISVKPTNYAARVEKDYDGCNEYVTFHLIRIITINERNDTDLRRLEIQRDWNADFRGYWSERDEWFCGDESGTIQGGSAYFNIAESVMVARIFADGNRDDSDTIDQVDVAYPDPTSSGNAYENPTWDEIYIPPPNSYTDYRDYGFTDEVIVHEYGHHLEDEISEMDLEFGQDHDFCTEIDEEFAWSEGFPTYFSAMLANKYRNDPDHNLSFARQNIPGMETPGCRISHDIEGGIEAVLWDLTDDFNSSFPDAVNESFDTISGQEGAIMKIFDTEMDNDVDAPDICQFVWGDYGWKHRFGGLPYATAIDAILSANNITSGC